MTTRPQTTFAAGRSPWPTLPGQAAPQATPKATRADLKAVAGNTPGAPAARTPRKAKASPQRINIAQLAITDDPLPPGHALGTHKYDALFDQLQHGQALKCEPEETQALAKALQHYLRRTKKPGTVTQCADYPADGKGRVWLLKPAKASPRNTPGGSA